MIVKTNYFLNKVDRSDNHVLLSTQSDLPDLKERTEDILLLGVRILFGDTVSEDSATPKRYSFLLRLPCAALSSD